MEKVLDVKMCNKCYQNKTIDNFSKCKKNKDGFSWHCKKCRKEYYLLNKERTTKSAIIWRKLNKKRIKDGGEKYYELNKKTIKAKQRIDYQLNKEKILAKKKIYYQLNKEKILEKSKNKTCNKKICKE